LEYFIQQLFNGLTLGSIYGLVAIGYTMVYGIIGMINFAHGDIFMLGGFAAMIVFLVLTSIFAGLPVAVLLLVMLIVAMLTTSLWNWTIECGLRSLIIDPLDDADSRTLNLDALCDESAAAFITASNDHELPREGLYVGCEAHLLCRFLDRAPAGLDTQLCLRCALNMIGQIEIAILSKNRNRKTRHARCGEQQGRILH
jgi:hypothetical protein